ncbi:hypothetical protein C7448_104130 [Tenacibaculum gallaicum]|uniref:DUF2946 domain-containing protein n=2 Tax=Tenacibaculum gallaicum TaxID=561505 RepID=A0A3E0HVQ7_9FLAO|nr:hypothetical protein C7448_104130 [Tenacibaculum gallaicum]
MCFYNLIYYIRCQMESNRLKNSIAYLFLVLFLSMKVGGLHVLSHTDDKDHTSHCTICDHAVASDLTPLVTPDTLDFSVENNEYVVLREVIKDYNFIISGIITTGELFSRPPPSLV